MFPHTPDNTFLGFVVEDVNSSLSPPPHERRDIALVYGKDRKMWDGKEKLLGVSRQSFIRVQSIAVES